VFTQSLTLGIVQVMVSFTINIIIVLVASKLARWFSANPKWIRVQKWFMASVLTGLAAKMALEKGK
jgi:threonine/homoserine/homoserine lactone efflux protein